MNLTDEEIRYIYDTSPSSRGLAHRAIANAARDKAVWDSREFINDWIWCNWKVYEPEKFETKYGFKASGDSPLALLADYEKWLHSQGIERPK